MEILVVVKHRNNYVGTVSVGTIGADAIVFIYQIIVLFPVAITADPKYLNFTRGFEVEWACTCVLLRNP